MIVTFYLYFLSVADIEDERPSYKDIPDLLFPVAQADINVCSTYAAVSYTHLTLPTSDLV